MVDEPTPCERPSDGADATTRRDARQRLVREARKSLRASDVYARALGERLELACGTDPHQLSGIPADVLVHLIAVSDAFQDGACHALWLVEPELARNARVLAGLARDGVRDSWTVERE
ncbi:MAG TPA: hypothetical protein VK506_04345 [Conexibacter sp.]|nr:hypothetical protein [Conexibacter sp.]